MSLSLNPSLILPRSVFYSPLVVSSPLSRRAFTYVEIDPALLLPSPSPRLTLLVAFAIPLSARSLIFPR